LDAAILLIQSMHSSYNNRFNYPAKKLFKRLLQLGGKPLIPRGDGDDQHDLGVDGALVPWLKSLWDAIFDKWPLEPGLQIISDDTLRMFFCIILATPSFRIKFLDADNIPEISSINDPNGIMGRVVQNSRLTAPDHFQDIRHVELHASNAHHLYKPGDILLLRPQNKPSNVLKALKILGLENEGQKQFAIVEESFGGQSVPRHWPKVMTLDFLFTHILDICGRPRRHFFQLLSFFALSEQHAERLKELASPEGQDDLFSYSYAPKRTILEVLLDFPCQIPLDYLLDLIPEMKPRSFSISSSPYCHLNSIHLTVAIIDYKTVLKERRTGVCTSWISDWEPDSLINFSIQRGSLNIIDDITVPVILIGPGTGIAPMRSFLIERIKKGAKSIF
jgi:sulfite reductase alpha subunit-like flavoprotein